jgi:hypothetical protein
MVTLVQMFNCIYVARDIVFSNNLMIETDEQLQQLFHLINEVHFPVNQEHDVPLWRQTSSAVFDVKSFYLFIKQGASIRSILSNI